jgi:hypothetical protein
MCPPCKGGFKTRPYTAHTCVGGAYMGAPLQDHSYHLTLTLSPIGGEGRKQENSIS